MKKTGQARQLRTYATSSPELLEPMLQRRQNAVDGFLTFAMEHGDLTLEQARKALARYQKERVIKLDVIGGQFTFKHGAFAERDVLRRAAELPEEG